MFELQMSPDSEFQASLRALCEVGDRAPSSEQKLSTFKALSAKKRDAAIVALAERLNQLASTAEQVNSANERLREMIEDLSAVPWHVAMFKSWVDTGETHMARVLCAGEERLVGISSEVDKSPLGIGETVFLSARRNTLMTTSPNRSFSGGQLGEVSDVLGNGDLIIREHDQQVRLERGHWLTEQVISEVIAMVRKDIGAVAAFKEALIVARLPKTRSGKILRKTLRAMVDGDEYVVPSTIEDPAALDEIKALL